MKILASKSGKEEVKPPILDYTNLRQRRDIPDHPLLILVIVFAIMIVCVGIPIWLVIRLS